MGLQRISEVQIYGKYFISLRKKNVGIYIQPGDRVTVNVETFCGECFFCKNGYVNNCTAPDGGWALGCRIDGGQAEYVRVPYADQGLNVIPDEVTDQQALFVGDVLLAEPENLEQFVKENSDHGGVDGCDCEEILRLIREGRIDTTPLITHTYPLAQIAEAYDLFENRKDHVIKVAVRPR